MSALRWPASQPNRKNSPVSLLTAEDIQGLTGAGVPLKELSIIEDLTRMLWSRNPGGAVSEAFTKWKEIKAKEKAIKAFFDACSNCLSNFDEYTQKDRDAIEDRGFETFGNGSVCLVNMEKE